MVLWKWYLSEPVDGAVFSEDSQQSHSKTETKMDDFHLSNGWIRLRKCQITKIPAAPLHHPNATSFTYTVSILVRKWVQTWQLCGSNIGSGTFPDAATSCSSGSKVAESMCHRHANESSCQEAAAALGQMLPSLSGCVPGKGPAILCGQINEWARSNTIFALWLTQTCTI